MAIRRIQVQNFKSFRHAEVALGDFNVIVGANAAGKSNLVQLFRFLRDLSRQGLEDALSLQGGQRYLHNMKLGLAKPLAIEATFDDPHYLPCSLERGADNAHFALAVNETRYALRLYDSKHINEELRMRGTCFREELTPDQMKETSRATRPQVPPERRRLLGDGEISRENSNGHLIYKVSMPPGVDEIPWIGEPTRGTLLEQSRSYFFEPVPLFRDCALYDFDPKASKRAIPLAGRAELEEDGSNLVMILKRISEDREEYGKFLNLLRYVLPHIQDFRLDPIGDEHFLFKVQESFQPGEYVPASFLSDGTIHVCALIVALYFDRRAPVIIEEPERSVHPSLISKIIGMMKEVAPGKQILLTTHSPEVVRYAGLDPLLLVSRDPDGFSCINRPADHSELKVFLENEMGIEELYLNNLLAS